MDAVGPDKNVTAGGCAMRAVAAEEITSDTAFVLRERAQPMPGVDAGFAKPRAHGLVNHCLQTSTVDRELRIFEAGIGPPGLAPDLLADAVHIEEFVGPNSDLVEFREKAELRKLLDGVWQRVDADTELAHRVGLFEYLAVNSTRLQHEGRREPADAAANDNRLHSHTRRQQLPT